MDLPVVVGAGLGGLDVLSSLKISAILPKKAFLLVASEDWVPSGGGWTCGLGGLALSPPKPTMREEQSP